MPHGLPYLASPDLAVVPIVVNAGAAILPALIAAAASFVTLLFRPRELIRTCRRRPLAASLTFATIAAAGFGLWLVLTQSATSPQRASGDDYWHDIALALIAQKDTPVVTTATAPVDPTQPHFLAAQGFTGTNHDGLPTPEALRPTPLWSEEREGYVLSSPRVRDGRVYGAACVISLVGQSGVIFCRDAATGKEIWRRDTDAANNPLRPFFSSPALTADGKRLVIGQGLHEDRNCQFLCLDTATGQILWATDTELHIESSPAIFAHPKYGDVAVVGCGAIEGPDHKPTSDPGYVLAVQIATGRTLWRHPVNDPESSPAVGPDNTIYIGSGFNGNAVVALRPETDEDLAGKPRELWRTTTPFPATGGVTLINDTVLIGCGNGDFVVSASNPKGAVIAINAATSKILWQHDTGDAVLGEIAVRDNTVIAPCKTGEVLALDLATGSRLWTARISGRNGVLAGVGFTGSRVYAVSKDGYLGVLDATPSFAGEDRVLERIFVNDERNPGDQGLCLSAPTLAQGRIYLGTETGGIRCFAGRNLVAPGSASPIHQASAIEPSTAPATQSHPVPATMPSDELDHATPATRPGDEQS